MANHFIYDFETLSQEQDTCAVLSLAYATFDDQRMVYEPYTFDELINEHVKFVKFQVKPQKELGRIISPDTLDWWKKQSRESILKSFKPNTELDQPLSVIVDLFSKLNLRDYKYIWTRGNTFDPVILKFIFKQFGQKMPYDWWQDREIRSFIDGTFWGEDMSIRSDFIPVLKETKITFVPHDPEHDVAMDILRIQTCIEPL